MRGASSQGPAPDASACPAAAFTATAAGLPTSLLGHAWLAAFLLQGQLVATTANRVRLGHSRACMAGCSRYSGPPPGTWGGRQPIAQPPGQQQQQLPGPAPHLYYGRRAASKQQQCGGGPCRGCGASVIGLSAVITDAATPPLDRCLQDGRPFGAAALCCCAEQCCGHGSCSG